MIPVLAHSDKPSVDDAPSPWWSERILALARLGRPRRLNNPFRDFDSSPDVIRIFVTSHVRFPFSLRKLKMSSPRSLRLVGRFGTTRPFAVSTARVDVYRTCESRAERRESPANCRVYRHRRQRATLVRPRDSRCSDFVGEQSTRGRSTWPAERLASADRLRTGCEQRSFPSRLLAELSW
jgi:hypothetical protein